MPKTAVSEAAAKRVGQAIRRARQARGLTQAQLAERLEVNPSYVTNVEAGRVNLTVGQLAHIGSALDAGLRVNLAPLDTAPVATGPFTPSEPAERQGQTGG
jgi:UDP-N-acetylglucosamine 1-carboxyvinyltransferase